MTALKDQPKLKCLPDGPFGHYDSYLKTLCGIHMLTLRGKNPYLAQICDETGMPRKTVFKACRELQRAGVIDSGNTKISTGRMVRIWVVEAEGSSLAHNVLMACFE